jgi:hypothetical protein
MNESDEYQIEFDRDANAPDFATIMELMAKIERLGFDENTSARYARLIGYNPIVDKDGVVLVTEGGKTLAKVKLELPAKLRPQSQ